MIKRIKKFLNNIFFSFFRLAFSFFPIKHSKTILIVRTDGIGDLVFFARYLPSIKKHYKDYKLCLVCRKESYLIAQSLNIFDKIIPFHYFFCRNFFLNRIFLFWRIRNLKPKFAFYYSFHRVNMGDEMTLFSGAEKTYCFYGNDESISNSLKKRNEKYYSVIIETSDNIPEHEKYQFYFKTIAIKSIYQSSIEFTITEKEKHKAITYIENEIKNKSYVVISPKASYSLKEWPQENYIQLVNKLTEQYNLSILLCGGKNEKTYLESIVKRANSNVKAISDFSLLSIIEILKRTSLFIGNDSGLLHIATTLGVPSIGILFGGHFSRYFPYGSMVSVANILPCFECNNKCIYSQPLCLTEISPESVMEKVQIIFDTKNSYQKI